MVVITKDRELTRPGLSITSLGSTRLMAAVGHTNYQAAYIARIIHSKRPSISQNAIGLLFGIKSISTYLAKLDTKESIKKPLEDLFASLE